MYKKVATGTLKGGTGKTMSLFNISGCLAQTSKVLMVDCDPQCNLTSNTGVDIADPDQPSVRMIFEEPKVSPETLIWEGVIPDIPSLDLIPSSLYLIDTEMNLVSKTGRERLLSNWIRRNNEHLKKYDYIMFDTNPSMGLVNQNVFAICDSIILVTDVGFNSILGAQAFVYLWEKCREGLMLEDNIRAMIINNSDKRTTLLNDLKEYITSDEDLSKLLVLPDIPSRVAMKRTEGSCLPITFTNDGAAEIIAILVENLKRKGAL